MTCVILKLRITTTFIKGYFYIRKDIIKYAQKVSNVFKNTCLKEQQLPSKCIEFIMLDIGEKQEKMSSKHLVSSLLNMDKYVPY